MEAVPAEAGAAPAAAEAAASEAAPEAGAAPEGAASAEEDSENKKCGVLLRDTALFYCSAPCVHGKILRNMDILSAFTLAEQGVVMVK